MKKLKVIKINRAKWRTGAGGDNETGEGDTHLLNDLGYQCCLGFIARQKTKKSKKNFLNISCPEGLTCSVKYLSEKNELNDVRDTALSIQAMDINDDSNTTPEEKEKLIKQLFRNKYKLVFFGKFEKKQ
jgi:hypothetical protein